MTTMVFTVAGRVGVASPLTATSSLTKVKSGADERTPSAQSLDYALHLTVTEGLCNATAPTATTVTALLADFAGMMHTVAAAIRTAKSKDYKRVRVSSVATVATKHYICTRAYKVTR